MSKPATTLGNKGSYYFNADNLKTIQETLETLADKGVSNFSDLVVYLCKNAGKQTDTALHTRVSELEETVDTLSKQLEEKTGKLLEAETSIQSFAGMQATNEGLQKENAELNASWDKMVVVSKAFASKLAPKQDEEKDDLEPDEIMEAFFDQLNELLSRFKYEQERDQFVNPIELIERSYRVAKGNEINAEIKIKELTGKVSSVEPFRLGEHQVVINFDPALIEKLRKCRSFIKKDGRIKTDDPSEVVGVAVNEYLRIYYDHILNH